MKSKVSALPRGLSEKADTAILCNNGLGLARTKNEVFQSSGGGEHAYDDVSQLDSKTHIVRGCEMYKEERNVLSES